MEKKEEKKNHVWEEHTGSNYFIHYNHMNLFQTAVCVCFHVLPSKSHVLGWEVFTILVLVFKLPVNH